MFSNNRKAFTMLELVFVIVIIGVLSAIAIPKFDATAKLAQMSKGKNTLAIVRSAIATERQKSILRGTGSTAISIYNAPGRVFTRFTDINGSRILDNDLPECTDIGCWSENTGTYTFYRDATTNCTYSIVSNRFVDGTTGGCTELEE